MTKIKNLRTLMMKQEKFSKIKDTSFYNRYELKKFPWIEECLGLLQQNYYANLLYNNILYYYTK